MQQHDADKIRGAFLGKKRYEGYTLDQLASEAGVSRTTIVRILEVGRGRPENIDKVARALGFTHGRQDVLIRRRSA